MSFCVVRFSKIEVQDVIPGIKSCLISSFFSMFHKSLSLSFSGSVCSKPLKCCLGAERGITAHNASGSVAVSL